MIVADARGSVSHHHMIRLVCIILVSFVLASWACATDHFFIFGGGYSPQGNQVSLEKNVLYFQRVLRDTGKADCPQHYLFADGADPGRDLQFIDPDSSIHRLNQLLAAIFGREEDIYNAYRSSEVPHLNAPANREAIDEYFNTTACKLSAAHPAAAGGHPSPGDRLFIYFTGHGGRAEPGVPQNTSIELWDHKRMRMREFVARLDKVPPGVPVVVVMVQCFSGGFANIIFKDGDPTKGLDVHSRVGFFSTVYDRTADGCTPDVNEANYQDYSSYFWAALSGRTRLGALVAKPDYDGDGTVSFDEAHAYALMESNSIDVSVKTSDALLRHHSILDPNKKPKGYDGPVLTPDTDYATLLPLASPTDRAVLEGLSSRLGFTESQRATAVRRLADQIEDRRQKLADDRKKLFEEYNTVRGDIANTLKTRWPELSNPYHPAAIDLIHDHPADLLTAIQNHPRYPRLHELTNRLNTIDADRLGLERRWAKCQRLLRTLENVALAQNLARAATPEIWKRYESLVKAEHGTLAQ